MLKDGIEERFHSIARGMRKYRPVNCSKGRGYLEPYYDIPIPEKPSPPRSRSPVGKQTLSTRPVSTTPRPSMSQQQSIRPFHRKPQSVGFQCSKASLGPAGRWGFAGQQGDSPSLIVATEDCTTSGRRLSFGKAEQHTHRACSYCDSPENLARISSGKAPKTPPDVKSRLTDFIANCDRPKTVSARMKRISLKLSVSFSDLKECLNIAKDNTGRGEIVPNGNITQTIRNLRRQRREETRNVGDKATLQLFVDQKREVSNYIITKFRRMRMWKHIGNIVPRKLEDSMNQYWILPGNKW